MIQFLIFCACCFIGFHVLRFMIIAVTVLVVIITRKEEKAYKKAKIALDRGRQ
jgi:hypothetical protein